MALRRAKGLRRVSSRRQRERSAFDAVYWEVNARSRGLCELDGHGFHWASEHHHLFKPRRSHHTAAEILHVCRVGHTEFDRPYRIGRRVPTTFDVGLGRYRTEVVYAADKFALRNNSLHG